MKIKDTGAIKTTSKIFNVPLSSEDRNQLEALASNWNLSLAGTLRRCIQTARDRNTKNALSTTSILVNDSSSNDDQVHILEAMLAIHNELAATRTKLDCINNLLQSNKESTANDLASIHDPIQNTALLLSALISTSNNKDKIEAEIQRLRSTIQTTME